MIAHHSLDRVAGRLRALPTAHRGFATTRPNCPRVLLLVSVLTPARLLSESLGQPQDECVRADLAEQPDDLAGAQPADPSVPEGDQSVVVVGCDLDASDFAVALPGRCRCRGLPGRRGLRRGP